MEYTKNEKVKKWEDKSRKDRYEYYLNDLYKWNHINRLDELICLIDSFVGNKEFEKFFNNYEYGLDEGYDYDMKSIPILHGAYDAMNIFDYFPLSFSSITHHLVVARNIATMVGVIELCFVHYNNHLLTLDDDRVILLSNIFEYITLFVEDYDNPHNNIVERDYEYYKKFFKKVRKTYWKNKDVKKFAKTIEDWRLTIIGYYNVEYGVHNVVEMSAIYLMVCNALKNGRDAVDYEDVVVGYLTCYKIIFNDIRPLVYELYDDAKWGYVDRQIKEYKPLDKSPFENIKK